MSFIVKALPEVRLYLSDLIRILYEKEYFSFEDNAIEYVTDLVSRIEKDLPFKVKNQLQNRFLDMERTFIIQVFEKIEKQFGTCSLPSTTMRKTTPKYN